MEYRAPDEHADSERERLGHLSSVADRGSGRTFLRLGLGPGWDCLEVGPGNASMARWLSEQVGPAGRVLAVDIDLRFVDAAAALGNLEFRRHDIAAAVPEPEAFDLAHARAVLEHVPERERALANMVSSVRPGGWVVVQDVDWRHFDAQELPEPFGTLHRSLGATYDAAAGYDRNFGGRLHVSMSDAGLTEVELRGRVFAMHGGTPSAEWYLAALERAVPAIVDGGLMDADAAAAAIDQARDPSFLVQSPVSVAAWGRRPA